MKINMTMILTIEDPPETQPVGTSVIHVRQICREIVELVQTQGGSIEHLSGVDDWFGLS